MNASPVRFCSSWPSCSFSLAAFDVALGSLDLVTLGLAAFAASFLLGSGGLNLRR